MNHQEEPRKKSLDGDGPRASSSRVPSAISVALGLPPHHSGPESSRCHWPLNSAMAAHSALPTVQGLVPGVLVWVAAVARLCRPGGAGQGEPTWGPPAPPTRQRWSPLELPTVRVRAGPSPACAIPCCSCSTRHYPAFTFLPP